MVERPGEETTGRSPTDRLDRIPPWIRARAAPLALSAVAGVVVFVVATTLFPEHSVNHDEAVYLQQAELLLEGRFGMSPPQPGAVRPWFFLRDGGYLYPKYAPVPAGVFAVGKLLTGSYRVALGGVAAGVVGLTYGVTAAAFDRRTGLLAGALLLATPTFLLTSATFLPYAPTTLLNLVFALAYVRAARREGVEGLGYAALAGVAIGLAFFGRPFTAVLFATPFVGHALWTLWRATLTRDRAALRSLVTRHGITGALGVAFVGVTLAYNARMTGSPWLFPFQAFAPMDGIGFGRHRILDHAVDYTPALALRANGHLLWEFATRWTVAPPLGTGLFAVGIGRFLLGRDRGENGNEDQNGDGDDADKGDESEDGQGPADEDGDGDGDEARGRDGIGRSSVRSRVTGLPDRHLRGLLAGVLVSVVLGNVLFWGNYNVLGDLPDPTDGFVGGFGPFYHFDALVVLSAFGAAGALALWRRTRKAVGRSIDAPRGRSLALVAVLVAALAVGAGAEVAALDGPVADHAAYTDRYVETYEPLENAAFENAVVFVPSAYGPWLNHPFQSLRNDPAADGGLEGPVVYARDRDTAGDFAVLSAYDRTPYRFNYRGQWTPDPADTVEPKLRRLRVRGGERLTVETTVSTPDNVRSGYVRLGIGGDAVGEPIADPVGNVTVRWQFTAEGARIVGLRVDGEKRRVGENGSSGTVSLPGPREAALTVTFSTPDGATLTYRQELDVRPVEGRVQAIWPPESSVCRIVPDCGLDGTYLPDHPGVHLPGVWMNATATTGEE